MLSSSQLIYDLKDKSVVKVINTGAVTRVIFNNGTEIRLSQWKHGPQQRRSWSVEEDA